MGILDELLGSNIQGGQAGTIVRGAQAIEGAIPTLENPVVSELLTSINPSFGPAALPLAAAKGVLNAADLLISDANDRTNILPVEPSAPLLTPTIDKENKVSNPEDKFTPETKALFKRLIDDTPEIDVTLATAKNLNKALAAMGAATDVDSKLQAALAVASIGEQVQAIRMGSYMEQANIALGLDELNIQITTSMNADASSPYNPGDGSYSEQTQSLIDRKNTLTLQVPGLAQQYAMADHTLTGPLAAAQAVLRQLPGIDRLEQSKEIRREKRALVESITDVEAKNYASMTGQYTSTNWSDPVDVFNAKRKFYSDKEFQKLTQTNILSINDPLSARQLYGFAEEPIARRRAYALLERMEYEHLGVGAADISPEEKARRLLTLTENTRLLQIAFEDKNVPEERRKIIEHAINTSGLTGKAKTRRSQELMYQAKEEVLIQATQKRFISDVTQWKGFNTTDPAVELAIAAGRKLTGTSSVPIDVFTAQYLEHNPDNLLYNERLGKLRAYITSSANVAGESAIMPQFSGEDVWNSIAPSSVSIWLKSIMRQ